MGEQKFSAEAAKLERARRWAHVWGAAMASQHSPHAKLIDNRHAFEVLEVVYRAIPGDTQAGPIHDDPLNTTQEMYDYQLWLHQRLHASGLAKALAAGPAFLPEITSTLPQPWRLIARLFAPRNYTQLTRQILRNLAWYLDQHERPVTPIHKLRSVLLISLILTAMLTLCLVVTTGLSQAPWPVIVMFASALGVLILTVAMSFGSDTGRHKANCAELYAYLLESYAEPDSADENTVKSLLRELGRDPDPSREALLAREQQRGGRFSR